MSRKPDGRGTLTTEAPSYDATTKRFAQVMNFRSNGPTLDGPAIQQVLGTAIELFKGVLVMNELDDMAWPPDKVEVAAHNGFKGAFFMFATRADNRKTVIVLQ